MGNQSEKKQKTTQKKRTHAHTNARQSQIKYTKHIDSAMGFADCHLSCYQTAREMCGSFSCNLTVLVALSNRRAVSAVGSSAATA